jgi:hypothetical protein
MNAHFINSFKGITRFPALGRNSRKWRMSPDLISPYIIEPPPLSRGFYPSGLKISLGRDIIEKLSFRSLFFWGKKFGPWKIFGIS